MKLLNLDGACSYLPVLEAFYKATRYVKVLEIVEGYEGSGEFSTRFFMSMPSFDLITIQTNPSYKSINPEALNITDFHQLEYLVQDPRLFDIVLIDTRIEYSYWLVDKLFKNSSIILVHDSQTSIYCFDKVVLPEGWCYADFVFHRPWTGVFTRYKNKLNEILKDIPGVLYDKMEHKVYVEKI